MVEPRSRPLPARCARPSPSTPTRPACRRPRASCDRDPRLRDGQPALGREGARARRRASVRRPTTTACARPTRSCCRASARSARRWRRLRGAGSTSWCASGHAGVPVIGICLGMQLLFEHSTELGGRAGIGVLEGEVRALDTGGLKVPQIGWNRSPGAATRRSARGCPSGRRCTTCTRSRPDPAHAEVVLGTAHYGSEFVSAVEPRQRLRRPVPPREVERARPRAAAQLRALSARRRMIFLPAIDIRGGKAVRLEKGDFDTETVYVDDPLEAARTWVEAGARSLHVVDLDGAREGEPLNLEHLRRDHRRAAHPGAVRRRPALVRRGRATRWPPGATRVVARHRRLQRHRVPRRGARRVGRPRGRRDRRARRARVGLRLDRATQMPPEDVIQPHAGPRRQAVRLHERRPRRDAERPRPGRGRADRRRDPRPLDLLGRDRVARRPARAAGPAADEPRRRHLRQGDLRGPVHDRRGARDPARRPSERAAQPRHPLPRRRQGPRRQGHELRRHPRRRRPGRAGGALRGRGRRRARLPRHHRVARGARDDRRAGPPHRARRVHPVHDRRRDHVGRGRPGGARRGRRQGLGQLRGGARGRS